MLRGRDPRQRLVEAARAAIAVPARDAFGYPRLIDLDSEERRALHRGGERLRAAHAAEPGAEHEAAGERAVEVLARDGAEGLERSLEDAL